MGRCPVRPAEGKPGRFSACLDACTLWGSEMRFGVSCGQLGSDVVLVGESAEDLFPGSRPREWCMGAESRSGGFVLVRRVAVT
jgi:hypothetical protein